MDASLALDTERTLEIINRLAESWHHAERSIEHARATREDTSFYAGVQNGLAQGIASLLGPDVSTARVTTSLRRGEI